jgi:4-amino-4-deoxy-L-arabinose transferase-like glycosyltransferase
VIRAAPFVCLAAFVLLLFATLDVRPLYKADESRYAEIPREMLASGDWLTPRLNGLKYFEKPPLQYWASAAFFELFGEHDWVARLWTALSALGCLLLAWSFGRRAFSPRAGALAALVLAGCPIFYLLAQINTLDMALTFFLSAAVFAFARGRMYLFWIACALALLSKGLVGIVLPGGAIALYILLKRDWGLLRKMKLASGAALFLVIGAPWFIALSIIDPHFAHFFFVQEHFERFTTKMHGRYQPAWYFIPILAFGIAPWLLPFFMAVKNCFEEAKEKQGKGSEFDSALFLALWSALVFVFFSLSDSKLPSYILPIFPALAVLIGRWLDQSLEEARTRTLLLVQAALSLLAGAALAGSAGLIVARLSVAPALAAACKPWIIGAGALLALGSLGALACAWKRRPVASVALLSCASFACGFAALQGGHGSMSEAYSIEEQAASVPPLPAGVPVFAVDFYDHTIPWYLRRTVTMVRYKDELAQPIGWEPGRFIPDLAGFRRAWMASPRAYAVFSAESFENQRATLDAPMSIVSRGPRYVIVRKP